MRIETISLFPEIAEAAMSESIMKRAQEKGHLEWATVNLRDFGLGKHAQVDDAPYGGGQGMVLKPEPLFAALESIEDYESAKVILLSPQGVPFTQTRAEGYVEEEHLIFISGHYEGVDQRFIDAAVDEEISIGDYVLSNGTIAANVVIDSIVRLIPGVLGDERSNQEESFSPALGGKLEGPCYTHPAEFRGARVPEVLREGNHAKILQWKEERALEKTQQNRPDLLP